MKGRTFERRRKLIEEIMEDALKKRIRDVRSMGSMGREKGVVLVELRDEKNKEEIFEKRRKLKRT